MAGIAIRWPPSVSRSAMLAPDCEWEHRIPPRSVPGVARASVSAAGAEERYPLPFFFGLSRCLLIIMPWQPVWIEAVGSLFPGCHQYLWQFQELLECQWPGNAVYFHHACYQIGIGYDSQNPSGWLNLALFASPECLSLGDAPLHPHQDRCDPHRYRDVLVFNGFPIRVHTARPAYFESSVLSRTSGQPSASCTRRSVMCHRSTARPC